MHFEEEREVHVKLSAVKLLARSTIIATKEASRSLAKMSSLKAKRRIRQVSKELRMSSTLAVSLANLSESKHAILKGAVDTVGR